MSTSTSHAITDQSVEFLKKPDEERKKIVVFDDDEFYAEVQALKGLIINPDYGALAGIGMVIGGPIGAGALAGLGWVAEEVSEWLSDRPLPFLPVKRSECARLKFPPGHPQHKVYYIKHPYAPDLYYPLAEFHPQLFNHKFEEVVEILKAVGASSFAVKYEYGWTEEVTGNISLPVSTDVDIGVKGGNKRRSSSSKGIAAKYVPPKIRALPEGLVWYPYEPDWHGLVKDALEYRVTSYKLELQYEDTYGVDAALEAQALKLKIGLGGEFKGSESTKWVIKANFGRRRKRA